MGHVGSAVLLFLSAVQKKLQTETDQVHTRDKRPLFHFAFIYTLCYIIESNFLKSKSKSKAVYVHAVRTYRGRRAIAPFVLTSALGAAQ